jgi:hypothetical protein
MKLIAEPPAKSSAATVNSIWAKSQSRQAINCTRKPGKGNQVKTAQLESNKSQTNEDQRLHTRWSKY